MHLFPFHTAEFLDHFWEQIIADVDASAIVIELEHRGIISDGDQKTIRQEVNATLQTQLLHACLKKTCNAKALTVKGNLRMKSFTHEDGMGERCVLSQCVCMFCMC